MPATRLLCLLGSAAVAAGARMPATRLLCLLGSAAAAAARDKDAWPASSTTTSAAARPTSACS